MTWARFHRGMAVFWLLNVPVALGTSLKSSVPYLVTVSLLTAVSGEMAASHGAAVRGAQRAESDWGVSEYHPGPEIVLTGRTAKRTPL